MNQLIKYQDYQWFQNYKNGQQILKLKDSQMKKTMVDLYQGNISIKQNKKMQSPLNSSKSPNTNKNQQRVPICQLMHLPHSKTTILNYHRNQSNYSTNHTTFIKYSKSFNNNQRKTHKSKPKKYPQQKKNNQKKKEKNIKKHKKQIMIVLNNCASIIQKAWRNYYQRNKFKNHEKSQNTIKLFEQFYENQRDQEISLSTLSKIPNTIKIQSIKSFDNQLILQQERNQLDQLGKDTPSGRNQQPSYNFSKYFMLNQQKSKKFRIPQKVFQQQQIFSQLKCYPMNKQSRLEKNRSFNDLQTKSQKSLKVVNAYQIQIVQKVNDRSKLQDKFFNYNPFERTIKQWKKTLEQTKLTKLLQIQKNYQQKIITQRSYQIIKLKSNQDFKQKFKLLQNKTNEIMSNWEQLNQLYIGFYKQNIQKEFFSLTSKCLFKLQDLSESKYQENSHIKIQSQAEELSRSFAIDRYALNNQIITSKNSKDIINSDNKSIQCETQIIEKTDKILNGLQNVVNQYALAFQLQNVMNEDQSYIRNEHQQEKKQKIKRQKIEQFFQYSDDQSILLPCYVNKNKNEEIQQIINPNVKIEQVSISPDIDSINTWLLEISHFILDHYQLDFKNKLVKCKQPNPHQLVNIIKNSKAQYYTVIYQTIGQNIFKQFETIYIRNIADRLQIKPSNYQLFSNLLFYFHRALFDCLNETLLDEIIGGKNWIHLPWSIKTINSNFCNNYSKIALQKSINKVSNWAQYAIYSLEANNGVNENQWKKFQDQKAGLVIRQQVIIKQFYDKFEKSKLSIQIADEIFSNLIIEISIHFQIYLILDPI